MFDFALVCFHKSLGATKILPEENFDINQRQKFDFLTLVSTFVLVPTKTDPITKEKSSKKGSVWSGGTAGVKIIFALLAEIVIHYVKILIIRV